MQECRNAQCRMQSGGRWIVWHLPARSAILPHYRRESTMGGMKSAAVLLGLAYGVAFSLGVRAQQAPGDGPRYINGTNLVRPADYREWIFLSSGLDMAYNPPPGSSPSSGSLPERHTFTNVFVNPSSYRSFMQTGKWPDRTIFV